MLLPVKYGGLGTHRARHRWCRGSSERCIVIGRSSLLASSPKKVRARVSLRPSTDPRSLSRRDTTRRTRSTGRSRSGFGRSRSDRTATRTARPPRPRSGDRPRRWCRPSSSTARSVCPWFLGCSHPLFPGRSRPWFPARFDSPRACSDPRDRSRSPIPSLRQSCTTGGTNQAWSASLIIVHVIVACCGLGPGRSDRRSVTAPTPTPAPPGTAAWRFR